MSKSQAIYNPNNQYYKTPYQTKVLTTSNVPSEMNFNNLVAGRRYRLEVNYSIQNDVGEDFIFSAIDPDGVTEVIPSMGLSQNLAAGSTVVLRASQYGTFTAQASGTLSFSVVVSTGTLQGFAGLTKATLYDITDTHQEVSFWS